MSVNLLMVNKDTGPLTEEIRASGADIVLLQEYTEHWHAALRAALAEDYPYECHVCRDDSFGAAVYSNRPFLGEPELDVPLGRLRVAADPCGCRDLPTAGGDL